VGEGGVWSLNEFGRISKRRRYRPLRAAVKKSTNCCSFRSISSFSLEVCALEKLSRKQRPNASLQFCWNWEAKIQRSLTRQRTCPTQRRKLDGARWRGAGSGAHRRVTPQSINRWQTPSWRNARKL